MSAEVRKFPTRGRLQETGYSRALVVETGMAGLLHHLGTAILANRLSGFLVRGIRVLFV
jgi:hypothetical protein